MIGVIAVIMIKACSKEGSSKMDRNNNPHKANLCYRRNTTGLIRSYSLDQYKYIYLLIKSFFSNSDQSLSFSFNLIENEKYFKYSIFDLIGF